MSQSARDRWRALPREVREQVIEGQTLNAQTNDYLAETHGYDPSAVEWFKQVSDAYHLAAKVLRQAARKERK